MVRTTNFGQRRKNEHFIVPPLAKISFHLLMARPIMIYFLHTKFICMIYKVLAEKLSAQIFLISKFWQEDAKFKFCQILPLIEPSLVTQKQKYRIKNKEWSH